MGDIFHFDSDLAEKYGIAEAVILYNLTFWLKKNKANNKHFYDGKHWTYNSVKAFNELFCFLSKDQVRRTLEKLESKGAIVTGNYNQIAYDRTTWYTLSDGLYSQYIDNSHVANMPNGVGENAKWNWQDCQMELAIVPNGIGENAKPIPDINTDTKIDIKNQLVSPKEIDQTDELTNILQQSQIDLYQDETLKETIKETIKELYSNTDSRDTVKRIDLYNIDEAISRYREAQEQKAIKNPKLYFKKCLLSAIEEGGLKNLQAII